MKCPCGYELPKVEQIKADQQILKRMTAVEKANYLNTPEDKAMFLGELELHAKQKGYKSSWAGHLYKQKFGEWPERIEPIPATQISDAVRKYIQYDQIRKARGFWGRRAS